MGARGGGEVRGAIESEEGCAGMVCVTGSGEGQVLSVGACIKKDVMVPALWAPPGPNLLTGLWAPATLPGFGAAPAPGDWEEELVRKSVMPRAEATEVSKKSLATRERPITGGDQAA